MKILRLGIVFSLLSPAAAWAQTEGVATFTMSSNSPERAGPQGEYRMYFSRNAYRIEMQMDLSSARGDRPEGSRTNAPSTFRMTMIGKVSEPDKIYTVNDERKTYSVTNVPKKGEYKSDATWTVKRLGRDAVAGFSCDNVQLTSSTGSVVDACLSPELVSTTAWFSAMSRRNASEHTWVAAMQEAGVKGFPVRMKFRSSTGQGGIDMQLVSFERKSISSAMFEIPAGYTETRGTMMGGMSPEQEKQMNDALSKMTPEQRKMIEDAMKKQREQQNPQ